MFQDLGISSDHPFASDLCNVLAFLESDDIGKAMELAEAIPDPEVRRIAVLAVLEENVDELAEEVAARDEIEAMLSYVTGTVERVESLLSLLEKGACSDIQVACNMAMEEISTVENPAWRNKAVATLATIAHNLSSPHEIILASAG